jgi:hypothetical protein
MLSACFTFSDRLPMRTEVHIHGSIFLCKGVRLKQVEQALRPWLDYLDVEVITDAHSVERDEPGIAFDAINICWTGEVGRNFQDRLNTAFQNIGPLTEYASEVEITYYPDAGDDEFFQVFVGPSPESIHDFRRQCVIEDAVNLLSRHLGKAEVDQVASVIGQMFDKTKPAKSTLSEQRASSTVIPLHPRGKHLH